MKIKEVEKLLCVSRSNIRFYEKEGLLCPERKENNYRDYTEEDVAVLKKILVLRKLGFTVDEIASMQKGQLSLPDAALENIGRLEKEIASLKGALKISENLIRNECSYETMDETVLLGQIQESEQKGQGFVDICKDYLQFELDLFDNMWKYSFVHDFKRSRRKHGIPIACGILLLMCIIRGISSVVLWHESFWEGFLYPFLIFVTGSAIILPVYILGKKSPKAARIIASILMVLCVVFIVLVVLGLVVLALKSIITSI